MPTEGDRIERRLAAILAADVAGYSRLMGANEVGTLAALDETDAALAAVVAEYERRRDETMRQLEGLPAVTASGGWSLLLDCAALGVDPADLSAALLAERVAATPMRGWGGPVADRHLRFVFSREPVERLALLGDRLRRALATLR